MSRITLLGLVLLTLTSCGDQVITAADGLNLHAVIGIIQRAQDAEDLEKHLNQPQGVNNLNLNGDGHINFIHVHEYQEPNLRGYSLTVRMDDDSIQEIADIKIKQDTLGFYIQIHGNPQIYGSNYFVTSRVGHNTRVPFLMWAFVPRPTMYVTPSYRRGYYPSWYLAPTVVPIVQYRTVTKTVVQKVVVREVEKPVITSTVASPHAGKSSPIIVAPLKEPTQTQKQFLERPETKQIQQATGFAKPKPADVIKPAVQEVQPARPVQTPPPTSNVAPTTSGRTTTDKQFQERPDKEIPTAKGFGNKSDPTAPAQVGPKVTLPAPTHTAPTHSAPTPAVSSPAPAISTPTRPRPELVHPAPQTPGTSAPAPRAPKTEEKKR